MSNKQQNVNEYYYRIIAYFKLYKIGLVISDLIKFFKLILGLILKLIIILPLLPIVILDNIFICKSQISDLEQANRQDKI